MAGRLFFLSKDQPEMNADTSLADITCGAFTVAGIIAASMVDVSDPVIVAIGTTVLGGLATAIKILWDRNNKLSAATDVALQKCEAEHKAAAARMDVLIQQVISLSSEVGMMRGRIQGFQEASEERERRDVIRDAASHSHDHS